MSEKQPIKAEIKDGKLIINGDTINLSALEELLEMAGFMDYSNAIENVFYRLCQLGSICSILTTEIDRLGYGNCFPEIDDIFHLKQLSDSLKKM